MQIDSISNFDKIKCETIGNVESQRVKTFKCEFCSKNFVALRNLKIHIRIIHEGRKDHKCGICGKEFGQLAHLKSHMKTVHEGVKDHKCHICGKEFGHLKNLKRHIKSVHEGQKDLKCETCRKEFRQSAHLKSHIKTVHDPKKKSQESIRNDVALLLLAKTKFKIIKELTGASKNTIVRVKGRLEAGQSLKTKSHGGHNKKLTPKVLNEIKLKFSIDPFMSNEKCAKIMGCNERTIRRAREKLDMASKNDSLKIKDAFIITSSPLPNRIKEEILEENLKLIHSKAKIH